MNEVCSKCGTVLLFGLDQEEIFWCPRCHGVILDSLAESLKITRQKIAGLHAELKPLISRYEKESLLISIYITRESVLHSQFLDLHKFTSYTYLLQYIIESDVNGHEECDCFSDNFQQLIRYVEVINVNLVILRLINNGWMRTIKVQNKDVKKYGFKVEQSLASEGRKLKFEGEQVESIEKFTASWKMVKENLEENGFYAKIDTMEPSEESIRNTLWTEFWASIRTKICLELAVGDSRLLNVAHPENVLEYMHVIDELVAKYPFKISYEKNEDWTKCGLQPVDIFGFFYPFNEKSLGLDRLEDFFITSTFRYVALGGMLLTSKGLFAGPTTLKILASFLKGKYAKEYLDGNNDVGKAFEDYVAKQLEEIGFLITSPLDSSKKLVNIKDDPDHPTLEIDILAEFQGCLYVIECKSIVISTDFITGTRVNVVKRTIDEQGEKQERRIRYVRNNLSALGFDTTKIKGIRNVLVTYNKEPIEKYGDIELVSVREISRLKSK